MIGRTISHFHITDKLGTGGMGEVYLAEDTRLGRRVALKFLREDSQQDQLARKRFLREAKSAAALDHPFICNIFEIGEVEGRDFISMEYVEGETLKERLAHGPMPLMEVLKTGKEIAEALEKAHSQGIVHRDLKPTNILLTSEGHAKVVDFGLSKQLPTEAMGDQEKSSTVLTEEGSTLGTLVYMSPEQVRGQNVDMRSDIFSFGVVVYEMITGVHPFRKALPMETATAIQTEKPAPLARYNDQAPDLLQHIVWKTLNKDPERRYQLIHEVRTNLEKLCGDVDDSGANYRMDVRQSGRWHSHDSRMTGRQKLLLGGALLCSVLVTAFATWALKPTTELSVATPPIRLEVNLSGHQSLFTTLGNSVAISADGKRLAYVAETPPDRPRSLYLRSLDRLESQKLQATEGAYSPFFSPDSDWLGFLTAEGELKKTSVSGGAPLPLCPAGLSRGAAWGSDGTIVFAPNRSGLMRVSAVGGTPQQLTRLEEGETNHSWPQFLPGSRHVLFLCYAADGNRIEAVEVATGQRKVICPGGRYPRYAESGHLLMMGRIFAERGTLLAAPFDLQRLEINAEPVPVVQDVAVNSSSWSSAHYEVSSDGTLVYLKGKATPTQYFIEWADRIGETEPLLSEAKDYRHARFSPDGRRLALEIHDGTQIDIWVYEWERDILSRLTFDAAADGVPVWSPDGVGFVFQSDRDGHGIYWRRFDGSGSVVRLTESRIRQVPYSWHPGGKCLAFYEANKETDTDIRILPLEGDSRSGWKAGEPTDFLKTPFSENAPTFSPDGRWLAYRSNESGRFEVYVRPFPGPGGKWQISGGGGSVPTWFLKTQELFYPEGDQFMVVAYSVEGDSFRAGRPRLWTEAGFSLRRNLRSFDLHPDGKRIAVFKAAEDQTGERTDHAVLIQNFFEVIRQKLASR